MKKLRFFSVLLTLLCGAFGIVDASTILAADGASAATAVNNADTGARAAAGQDNVGVHTTTEKNNGLSTDTERFGSPDLIDDPVDREVVKMFQSAFPVDQICRHIQATKQNGMRYKFYSVDTREMKSAVDTALGTRTGSGTAESPYVYTGTADSGTLVVDNGNIFDPSDVVSVPSVLGYDEAGTTITTADPFTFLVKAVSGNSLTIVPINGYKNGGHHYIPYLDADAVLYRLGHAASEGDVQTAPYAALPEPDELYMQIFKTQIMESTISMDSDKEVNWSFSDQQELALYDLRREIERCYIMGVKGYTKNSTTKRWVYTCSGCLQQILAKGTVVTYDASQTMTDASLMSGIIKPIFLGNSGSATRYMFAGSDFVTTVATINSIQRQIGATEVVRKFGIDWKTLQFMSWQINLYQHPLLDELGLSKCAFVLDIPYVRKEVFRSLKEDALELVKAGVFDGKSSVWTEISSIALKYPKCHAFIRETAQYAPAKRIG